MDQTTKARTPPGPAARPAPAHPGHQSGNRPHQHTGHQSGNRPHQHTGHRRPGPHHAASTT